jgi:hypothetical protein
MERTMNHDRWIVKMKLIFHTQRCAFDVVNDGVPVLERCATNAHLKTRLMFVIQVLMSSRGSEDQELKKSEAEL